MKTTKLAIEIGKKIRNRRISLKFSQEAFAHHINFDRSNYGAIERGERNISIITLARIALGLNIDIGELVPSLSVIKTLL